MRSGWRTVRARGVLAIMIAIAIALPCAALAQSSGGVYTMTKSVIAPGGAEATGGAFRLVGTVGQPAARVVGEGTQVLSGGFHAGSGATPDGDALFCDGFENASC